MEADDILPDDIKNVLQIATDLKKRYNEAKVSQRDLEETTKALEREVETSRECEEKGRATVELITQEVAKLQTSLSDMVDIKQENITLRVRVKEYKTKINELNSNLEKERLSCYELMQKSRKECEEKAAKNLSYAHAEVERLRKQLQAKEEQLRGRTSELQNKLHSVEHSKNEEIKHLTYDFQDKINKLQSALTATQAENRNIRDRMQFNTATYQKKIQELERRSSIHPALRTPGSTNKAGNKGLPQLQFLASEPSVSEDSTKQEPPNNQMVQKKRRKLFAHKNEIE